MAARYETGNRSLLGYDEFLVHQSSGPFSEIPSTDYAWDDGVFLAIFDVAQDIHLFTGIRVNPNSGMIGGYAGVAHDGKMRTLRFKRPWGPRFEDPDLALSVGPYRYAIDEAFQRLRISLGENEHGLSFDLRWQALAPEFLEPHRLVRQHGRTTTDQTRYVQAGTGEGTIVLDGRTITLAVNEAFSVRDHSWGVYYERPPLAPKRRWVRPTESKPQAMRLWAIFGSPEASGAFQVHESSSGSQDPTNDVLSVPFTGHVHIGPDSEPIGLVGGTHRLRFQPNTRIMTSGQVDLVDEAGASWSMTFERGVLPFLAHPTGYALGSWKDGGNIASYAGSDDLTLESDEYDLTRQPCAQNIYGQNRAVEGIGTEYAFVTHLTAPDGKVYSGQSYLEVIANGRYDRYGFTEDFPPSWLNMYNLMD